MGRVFFVACGPRSFFIAWLRFRRGRPRAFLARQVQDRLSERTTASGGPLRAEGFPKRRCQSEFVAAERRI